jgi:hypothetical protein
MCFPCQPPLRNTYNKFYYSTQYQQAVNYDLVEFQHVESVTCGLVGACRPAVKCAASGKANEQLLQNFASKPVISCQAPQPLALLLKLFNNKL